VVGPGWPWEHQRLRNGGTKSLRVFRACRASAGLLTIHY